MYYVYLFSISMLIKVLLSSFNNNLLSMTSTLLSGLYF